MSWFQKLIASSSVNQNANMEFAEALLYGVCRGTFQQMVYLATSWEQFQRTEAANPFRRI